MTPIKRGDEFVRKIRQLILEKNLLSHGDAVLVGVSGGADSIALVRVLMALREELSLSLSCAHVHHGIRGEDARKDMDFVQAFCEEHQLPLHLLTEDVPSYAKLHGLSVENAGRQVRYRFFSEHATGKIATAHTKDDNAETVLMNLIKGNLPLGIPLCRERIIRPLLGVTKAEIYAYLEDIGQSYVTDMTNFSADYTRNRIRLELIPAICEKFNRNFTNTVYHTTMILTEEQDYLNQLADCLLASCATVSEDQVRLGVEKLCQAPPALARKVIRKCYYLLCRQDSRLSYEHTEGIFALCRYGRSGQKRNLPDGIVAIRSGDEIYLLQGEAKAFFYPLAEDVPVEAEGYRITLTKQPMRDALFVYPIRFTRGDIVAVRSRREGDQIYFSNLGIHKKVSDFLIDKKIPLPLRPRIPVVAVNDEVRIITGLFYETVLEEDPDTCYCIIIHDSSR